MRLFQKRTPFILLITALLGLVSCQEKENIQPAADTSHASARLQSGTNLTIPMFYTMINRGDAVLSYGADGRLNRVVESPGFYVDYTYENHATVAMMYLSDKGILTHKFKYSAYSNAKGLITKATLVPLYPRVGLSRTEIFEHNALGQLTKHYSQSEPQERAEYSYDANGDLIMRTVYASTGDIREKVSLSYIGFGNDPLLADKYPLNPEHDIFLADLTKYGMNSKHLPRRITIQVMDFNSPNGLTLESDYYYNYVFNSDGYVTQRDCYNFIGGNFVQSKKYLYKVSPIVIKF